MNFQLSVASKQLAYPLSGEMLEKIDLLHEKIDLATELISLGLLTLDEIFQKIDDQEDSDVRESLYFLLQKTSNTQTSESEVVRALSKLVNIDYIDEVLRLDLTKTISYLEKKAENNADQFLQKLANEYQDSNLDEEDDYYRDHHKDLQDEEDQESQSDEDFDYMFQLHPFGDHFVDHFDDHSDDDQDQPLEIILPNQFFFQNPIFPPVGRLAMAG